MVMYIGGQKVSPIIKVGEINNQDKTITENGTYTADAGYTGLGEVTVNVPSKQPVITELNVTPTTSAQTIVSPSGTDGYSPVKVSAVTSSIDSNIVAGNIKKDITILGVTGNVVELNGETKVITPTTSQQVITPSSGKNAITQATVNAVTSNIDSNIIAGNIKKDVTILGVTGTLEEGITPTGTINITQNGIVDVTNYASANVNVSGLGIPREVSANGVYQSPVTPFIFSLPSNATDVGDGALEAALGGLPITSINFSSLTTVSGNNAMNGAFQDCTSLTSINFSSLTTVSGDEAMRDAFSYCTSLTSINFSSLTTVSGDEAMWYAFIGCSNLTNVDLSNLTTISGNNAMNGAFQDCTSLTSINFSSLTTVSGDRAMWAAFADCSSLSSLSFPSLTSISFGAYTRQFAFMLSDVTGCTVHFPSNLQSVIGSWSDVTNGFGGENTTVLFDLPATS